MKIFNADELSGYIRRDIGLSDHNFSEKVPARQRNITSRFSHLVKRFKKIELTKRFGSDLRLNNHGIA